MLVAPRKYLRSLIGIRICLRTVLEAYISLQRIFLLKFAKPDFRQQLVIDVGFRCHLTSFARSKAASPSVFVTRLRKYLRTRRVTSVSQIGTDRIVEIQFSDGRYRLFLEFYAGGNIILTDENLNILSLFRVVTEGAGQEELRVGLTYSLDNRQNYGGIPQLTKERVRNGLQGVLDRAEDDSASLSKKPKKKPATALRRALGASLNEFSPTLIDHVLRVTAFEPNIRAEDVLTDDSLLDRLMLVLGEAQSVIDSIVKSEVPKGYIIAKALATKALEPENTDNIENVSEQANNRNLVYQDFQPFRPQQFVEDPESIILEFDGFNRTVDEFFSSVEAQRLESRLLEREENAQKKLDTARQDHEKRINGLQQVQEMHVRKAQAIETNLERVQEVMAVVNGLIAQGMDWVEIARLIEMEQAKYNAIAETIKLPLKLFENTVTLLLTEANFDEEDFEGDETDSDVTDSDEEKDANIKSSRPVKATDSRLAVDIDLALSPWSNARQYYDQKKSAAVKEQKTLQSSTKAFKNTEKKISTELKKGIKQEKQILRPLRVPMWFEKFIFFISSENYLVLAGKDAQQNDILYRKYLKKGDIYVHADLDRAIPVIIKNNNKNPEDPIPPSTLSQAGTLTIATSNAWDSKAVMSAWWVEAEQVSKLTPAGDILNPGEFFVRDPKNFLPPAQLLLGFGLLFRVSQESKVKHLRHRFPDDADSKPEDFSKKTYKHLEDDIGTDEDLQNTSQSHEDTSRNQFDSTDERENSLHDILTAPIGLSHSEDDSESDEEDRNPQKLDTTQFTDELVEGDSNASTSGQVEDMKDSFTRESSEDASSENEQETDPKKDEHKFLEATQENDNKNESHADLQPSGVHENENASLGTETLCSRPKSGSDQSAEVINLFTTSSTPSVPSKPHTKKQDPVIRGKKGKNRKIKDKYANQDDEDRALALHLLGSSNSLGKTREDLAAKSTQGQNLAAQKHKQKEQNSLAAEKGKEAEKIRKMNFEKTVESLEDGSEEHVDLEAFLGFPSAGDDILDVLAMCGPWDAIGSRCKWRAKLQPGTTKKGKAIKEILGTWISISDGQKKRSTNTDGRNPNAVDENITTRTEDDLLRGIQEREVVGLVPVGKCRVTMGPGHSGGIKARGGGAAGKGHRGGRGSKKR